MPDAGSQSRPGASPADEALWKRIFLLHRELEIITDYGVARSLPLIPEETNLVACDKNPEGFDVLLYPDAARQWLAMKAQAKEDGASLVVYSGYRSIDRQTDLVRSRLAGGLSHKETLTLLTAPGYSEHHTGRAVDLGEPGGPVRDETFAKTTAYLWLTWHARDFGFVMSYPRDNRHGMGFQPWHWCWRG